MSIYYCKKTRRQFLVGSGKSLLALPLLPSLLPKTAFAQSSEATRRFMMFIFDHNIMFRHWPSSTVANTSVGSHGAMEVNLQTLGSVSSHSPALNHPRFESLKNNNLLTYVRGLDLSVGGPHFHAFHTAGDSPAHDAGNYPSIDFIMENCPSIYPSNTPISVRKALRIGLNAYLPFYRKVGSVVENNPHYNEFSLQNFYNETFSSLTTGTVPPPDFTNELKTNILNRVLSTFNSFRNGPRISSQDRDRLNQHMDYLSDLQRSISSVTPPPAPQCNRPTDPGNIAYSDPVTYNRTYMDLLAIAFRCGITKVGVMKLESHDPNWIPNLNIGTNVFHSVMHGEHGAPMQINAKLQWWRYFSTMISERFLAPLEEMEGDTGRSYLENMVTVLGNGGGWTPPAPNHGGHNGSDTQQIIIGSMGGRMRSGMYLLNPRERHNQNEGDIYLGPTVPFNRFYITMLQLMGAQPSEYAFATPNGQQGIGYYGGFAANYPRRNLFYQPIHELIA